MDEWVKMDQTGEFQEHSLSLRLLLTLCCALLKFSYTLNLAIYYNTNTNFILLDWDFGLGTDKKESKIENLKEKHMKDFP